MLDAISFQGLHLRKAAVLCTYESFAPVSETSKPFNNDVQYLVRLLDRYMYVYTALQVQQPLLFSLYIFGCAPAFRKIFLVLVTVVWSVHSVCVDYVQ